MVLRAFLILFIMGLVSRCFVAVAQCPDTAFVAIGDDRAKSREPQLAIWELREKGDAKAAKKLREQVENSLMNAKISNNEPRFSNSNPDRIIEIVDLEGGLRAVTKADPPLLGSPAPRDLLLEIPAYRLSERLSANVVPVTVEREIDGHRGIAQLFIRDIDDAKFVHDPHNLKLWDYLIAHFDRHPGNHLTAQGRSFATDNELTFSANNPKRGGIPRFDLFIEEQLKIVAEAGGSTESKVIAINQIAPTLLSIEFVRRLRSTPVRVLRQDLKELTDAEFRNFLQRRKVALAAIDNAERVLGPAIYPGRLSGLNRFKYSEEQKRLVSYSIRLRAAKAPAEQQRRAQDAIRLINRFYQRSGDISFDQVRQIDAVLRELNAFEGRPVDPN